MDDGCDDGGGYSDGDGWGQACDGGDGGDGGDCGGDDGDNDNDMKTTLKLWMPSCQGLESGSDLKQEHVPNLILCMHIRH